MSISGVIQITFLVWLLSCQYCSACGQRASAVGYASLSSVVMYTSISLQVAHSHVVYVTPNTTTPCPKNSANSSCHTLNRYSGSERLISDDTVVVLLKGTHFLSSTICIENRTNLTFIGEADYAMSLTGSKDQTPHPMSWINCTSSDTGIVFLNSTDIRIMNLGFDSCGGYFALDSDNISAALLFGLSYNVSIIRVIVNNTYGYGVHMNCVFGNIQINNSILAKASKTRDRKHGGNARLWFAQKSNGYCEHKCSKKHANLVIFQSSFIQGLKGSTGIEIIIECSQVYALLSNVNAINNTGGNVALNLTNFDYNAPNKVHIMNSIINGGRASIGGGMRFRSQLYLDRKHANDSCINTNVYSLLTVTNTNFNFNSAEKHGGAVYISHQGMDHIKSIMIKFINTSFVDNFGNGAVMDCKKYLTFMDYPSTVFNVRLEGCHFHGNSVPNNKSGPIINMILTYITIFNCSFMDNIGSVLTLLKSNLNFHGDISFVNNHADYGAALKVCEASLVTLNNNTHIWFANNTAIFKGGAVYSYQPCLDTPQPCLFQPKLHKNAHTRNFEKTLKLYLKFVNNSASTAGDTIYGGSLDYCFTITNYSYNRANSTAIMLPSYFDMSGQAGPSWVSSDLKRVCFCDADVPPLHYHCRTEHPVVEVHPGEMFNVSIITVGQMNGSTPGSIKAMLNDDNDDFDKLIVYKDRNASSSKCENMTFILQSRQKCVTIHLEVAIASPGNKIDLPSSSLDLQVLFKSCPIGFVLLEIDGSYRCACDPILLCVHYGCPPNLNITCNINRQEISFSAFTNKVWFGCLEKSSPMSCKLALSRQCHYCTAGSNLKVVNVFHLDDQCLPGRTGILCGACKPGFSRIIESNGIYTECTKCSSGNLLFLIPLFLLSGIALVVFLTVFNVTVTQGTLNGLFLYSTVAYSYPSIFYTGRNKFPWLFISWLNLNLGLEICAYNGMTGYHYMWLNCAYTFYLFGIQIFIIYLSRKFVFFTRLVGKNIVSVLATIIVLNYSRMLYIANYSLGYSLIYSSISNITSQPQRVHVAKFDGNITYFGLKHIPLFIVALIFAILVLFFTFSLLLVQCLQKQSSIWCLRWVEKLRPFYEAFTGPCHDNYRFWPGFLLLMRVAFFIHIVQNSSILGVAAVCFLIMSLGGIFPRGIYKKWKLNVLEFLFLLNLSFTFIVVEYFGTVYEYERYSHYKYMAAYLSVSFALFLFVCILLYHVYDRIKDTFIWKMLTKLFLVCTKKLQVIKLRRSHVHNNKHDGDEERAPLLPQPFLQ